MNEPERVLFTIGHSNHSLETFLGLLKTHRIETLVDTRSQPYSRYVPHFNPEALKPAVTAAGLRYVFLGKELGGRPEEAEFYDTEGHVLYGRVAESSRFLEGIAKLEKAAGTQRMALFCSEENPSVCHRRLLVGRVLTERGADVRHIRADGSLQSEGELLAEEETQRNAGGQQSLFDAEEVTEWKSIRSVSPARRPPSSSGS
jgi:uncharacterized protein (DUF488 family)